MNPYGPELTALAWICVASALAILGMLLLAFRERAAQAVHDWQVWRTTRALLKARDEAVAGELDRELAIATDAARTGAFVGEAVDRAVEKPTAFLTAPGNSLRAALDSGVARFLFRDEQPEPLPSDTVLLDRVHDQSRRDILRERALATVEQEQAREREIDAIMAQRHRDAS